MNNGYKNPHAKSSIVPDYYNPHNTTQDTGGTTGTILAYEPQEVDPKEVLKRKYPVRIVAAVAILVVATLAIPVGVYLNQKPTNVFLDADTPTPIPTISPTPSPSPTPTPTPATKDKLPT